MHAAAAQPPFARIDGDDLRTASSPLRLTVTLSARTRDQETAVLELRLPVTAARDDADRQLLREQTQAAGGSLSIETLAASLAAELRGVWERLASRADGDALAAELPRELIEAAARWAFSRGIEVGRDVQHHLELPDRAARARAAALEKQNGEAAAARLRVLEQRASLRVKIDSIKTTNNDAAAILAQLSPAEQSDALAVLASATPQADLLAVGGTRLLRLSLADPTGSPTLHPLPSTLGPARSVRSVRVDGRDCIAVGMQSGIHLLARDSLTPLSSLLSGTAAAINGFNAIATRDTLILATHSQLGVMAWNTLAPSTPLWTLPPTRLPTGPRLLVTNDVAAVFLAGPQLFGIDAAGEPTPLCDSPGDVVALHLDAASRLWVVTRDGILHTRSLDNGGWQSRSLSPAIEQASIALVAGQWRWLVQSASRLLSLSSDDAAVLWIDNIHAAHLVLGREAIGITVAADRQRFSIYDLASRLHVRDVHAGTLLQARIADAIVAPSPA